MTGTLQHSGKIPAPPAWNLKLTRFRHAIVITAFIAMHFATTTISRADLKLPHGSARPQAHPISATVLRGGVNHIILSASTESIKPVEFIIREAPKHGTLGEPIRDKDSNFRVSIPYTPPTDLGITEDEFLYAAKIPDIPVSGTVAVKITIVDADAKLEIGRFLNFDKVLLGEFTVRELTIKNTGNGDYDAIVQLPDPWHIPEKHSKIHIAPGESVIVPITFHPTEPGTSFYKLVLQPESPQGLVDISGVCYSPFSVSPTQATLRWDPEAKRRSALISISSALNSDQSLAITSDQRLWIDDKLKLLPSEKIDLVAWIPATDNTEYTGKVLFKNDSFSQEIEITAPPLPIVLNIAEPKAQRLAFGHHTGDPKQNKKVTIQNTGGETAYLNAEIAPPFSIVEGGESTAVPPGGSLTLNITMETGRLGDYEQTLSIIGGPDRIEIPVIGSVVHIGSTLPQIYVDTTEPAPIKEPSQTGLPSRPAPWAQEEYDRTVGIDSVKRKTTDSIPTVTAAGIVKRSKNEVHIAWPKPNGGAYNYVIETRWTKFDPATQKPQPYWIPLTGVDFQTEGDNVIAKLEGVPNETNLLLRVFTTDGVDLFSKPSVPFTVATYVPAKGGWFKWLLIILLGVGAATYYWWQRRQLED